MGGKSSSSKPRVSSSSRYIPREPAKEKFDVPEVDSGYPQIRPPSTPNRDIYHSAENKGIFLHARKVPNYMEDSWEELVQYLTARYRTDMMKVRSIFSWLAIQDKDIDDLTDVEIPKEFHQLTPRAFKKLIRKRQGSYASFFALLCRAAGIPCVVIKGISKATGYEVGMEAVDHLRDCWNAVYVSGWRLVHPLWAFKARNSFKNGTWVPTEVAKDILETHDVDRNTQEMQIYGLNEYYFFVDPAEMASVCLPDDPMWQLLPKPISFQKWTSIPYYTNRYHMDNIKVPSEYAKILSATNGVCGLTVIPSEQNTSNYQLACDLYFNIIWSKPETDLDEPIILARYVLMSRNSKDGKWYFEVRLPVLGRYRLTLYGGLSTRQSLPCICDIAISSESDITEVMPYPASPDIGFGPVSITEKAGLIEPSHTRGMIFVKPRQKVYITFKLERQLIARAKLVGMDRGDLDDYVSCITNNQSNLHIIVTEVQIPSEGEYALMIYCRPRESPVVKWANVCNYYITTDPPRAKGIVEKERKYQPAIEINTRRELEEARKSNDLANIQSAVGKFKGEGLHEVDGSLEKATLKIEHLELKRDLKDATMRKNLQYLDEAISNTERSAHACKLRGLLQKAWEERNKLVATDRFLHDVLEMKQATLTEMISYQRPAVVIHDVLQAMLLLLGENFDSTNTWPDVQKCMRRTGKDGVFRKIRTFDIANVPDATVRFARNILDCYEEADVRCASTGAAAFYLWVRNEVDKRSDPVNN